MKHPTSTNDNRGRHPYLIPHNWLPGAKLCFWDKYRDSNPDYCERMDAWAYSIQKRPKDDLIQNNNSISNKY